MTHFNYLKRVHDLFPVVVGEEVGEVAGVVRVVNVHQAEFACARLGDADLGTRITALA